MATSDLYLIAKIAFAASAKHGDLRLFAPENLSDKMTVQAGIKIGGRQRPDGSLGEPLRRGSAIREGKKPADSARQTWGYGGFPHPCSSGAGFLVLTDGEYEAPSSGRFLHFISYCGRKNSYCPPVSSPSSGDRGRAVRILSRRPSLPARQGGAATVPVPEKAAARETQCYRRRFVQGRQSCFGFGASRKRRRA